MPERLKKRALRVVGARQALRAVKEKRAEEVFLALDAGVPVTTVATMEELSQLCRVDVPSAAAAVLKSAADEAKAD